jgi:hypothetical protein
MERPTEGRYTKDNGERLDIGTKRSSCGRREKNEEGFVIRPPAEMSMDDHQDCVTTQLLSCVY